MSGNNVVYFVTTAASGFYPTALWVSDGTPGGTRLIASYPAGVAIVPLANPLQGFADAFLYAVSSNGNTDLDLTLGTPLSTHTVLNAPFAPLPTDTLTSHIAFLNPFEAVGGFTYNTGTVTVGVVNLLNPDPQLLLQIAPQSLLAPETVSGFTAVDGQAFFVDANAKGVARLYRTDGTVGGTTLITSAPTFANLTTETNATTGHRVFLSEVTAANHGELLAIGTADAAPQLINDFGAGTTIQSITNAGNTLFIDTGDSGGTQSLWQSDGSNAAPTLIETFPTGVPQQILPAADDSARVYFQLGNQVWTATASGATKLDDFTTVGSLFAIGSTLYFAADDGAHHEQLWMSDGTPAGTTQLPAINPTGDADPSGLTNLNGTLYFSATDGVHGSELWKLDGTTSSMVTDLDPGAAGSNPTFITPGGAAPPAIGSGLVTFVGQFSGNGVTDGTLAGTSVSNFGPPPEVMSVTLGGSFGDSVSVAISHGTADTTITVPVVATRALLQTGGLTYTTTGAYFTYTTTDFDTATETITLEFIGNTALAPVSLGAFTPSSGGVSGIIDRVANGGTEFFLVERADGNGQNIASELWSSDGTPGNTAMIANLGSVTDPNSNFFFGANNGNAVAAGSGWAALLTDETSQATSLFASTGSIGNFSLVAPGSIGLAGTIDNTGTSSLAFAGSKFFFSMVNAGTIEAVSTDATPGNTAILTTETPAASQTFGDFTASGSLVYFDDGVGGALFVSDGSAAGTHKLLDAGAFIGPYGGNSQLVTPSTASIDDGGTTLFYFAATVSGQTGLYFSDGSAVTPVKTSGLAQNAYITASGNTIYFVADGGTGFTTIWTTVAGSTSASPVIDPALFPAGSVYASAFGAPQNPTNLHAAALYTFAPDTFFLTPGTDTVAGGAGDTTIFGDVVSINAADSIDGGGGINNLSLTGTGTFDLSIPGKLDNITQVLVNETKSTILLRNGTSLTVKLSQFTSLSDTIIGANNSDTIIGSGNDTVIVGSSSETISSVGLAVITAATAGATISATKLEVKGGGTVALGGNVDITQAVSLDAATDLTVSFNPSDLLIHGSAGTDTITLNNASTFGLTSSFIVTGGGGGDHIAITGSGVVDAVFRDTAANLNGGTIDGYNFAPTGQNADAIDVTDFTFAAGETASLSGDVLTITNAAGTASTSITLPGAPTGGGFVLASDGANGTNLTYVPQIFTLTKDPDTVAATDTNQVTATDATLSSGDVINGGSVNVFNGLKSTLQLTGAGTFDLSLPAVLTGLSEIDGDTTGSAIGSGSGIAQTIILRDGLDTKITLGPGHDVVHGAHNAALITSVPENFGSAGYTVFVGDTRETVELAGQGLDVIHVTASTGLAPVSDTLQGSVHSIGTEQVDGGGIVGLSSGFFNSTATVTLAAPTHAIFTSTAPPTTVGSTGHDTIDVTNVGAQTFGGSITVSPNGGGDTVRAPVNDGLLLQGDAAQLDNTTIEGFNFLPAAVDEFGLTEPVSIDITDLAFSGLVATQFTGGTLTVTNNGTLIDTFLLPAAPGGGSFVAKADTAGKGTALTFLPVSPTPATTGTLVAGQTIFASTPGFDSLTVPANTLAANQTLDGAGGMNQLSLTGTGTFDLGLPAELTNFQVLNAGPGETVMLRAGLQMAVSANGATIVGANAPDPIVLENNSLNNTVVIGSPAATAIDGGLQNTFVISAATNGAAIYGGHSGQDKLLVAGGGGVVMGGKIYNIAEVDLTLTGAAFFANDTPGLPIMVSGDGSQPGAAPDTIIAGHGGDLFTDTSTGNNILVAGGGDDIFNFGTTSVFGVPANDTIYNFDVSGSDTIKIALLNTTTVSFDAGTLTVGKPGDFNQISMVLAGTYSGTFSAASDPFGGTDVTFSGTVIPANTIPCFAAGTRILTATGEVPVETLCEGDLLPVQLHEGPQPITWIGHRSVDCRRHPTPCDVWPVRIAANVFAPGRPHHDLWLSPDHAVMVDDVLIPIKYLINGMSIVQVQVDAVTYYHVELARHDVILAEGMPTETFLDTGNRAAFANGGRVVALHPEFGAWVWDGAAGAPLIVTGPILDAVRGRVNARAVTCMHAPQSAGRLA